MPIRANLRHAAPGRGYRGRDWSCRGQSFLEFALVIPLIVTIIVAGLDLARYVAIHSAANAASREATRYASAVGATGESPARYVNCTGIRGAARAAAPILNLTPTAAVKVTWEDGDGDGQPAAVSCPTTPSASAIHRLDRVVVTITTRFDPTIRLLPGFDVISVDRRTIVKESS